MVHLYHTRMYTPYLYTYHAYRYGINIHAHPHLPNHIYMYTLFRRAQEDTLRAGWVQSALATAYQSSIGKPWEKCQVTEI